MYGNSPDLVGEKMVTPSVEFDPAIYWCIDLRRGDYIC